MTILTTPKDGNIPSYNLSADGVAFGPDGLSY